MYFFIFQKLIKVTGSILSLLLSFLLVSNNTNAQPYFNKNVICDTCSGGAYVNSIIDQDNSLIISGLYISDNNPLYKWTFHKYSNDLSSHVEYAIHDSNSFGNPSSFFENITTKGYDIIYYKNIPDSVGWNGYSNIYLYKFDSSFNLFSKQKIETMRYDKQDLNHKTLFLNNKIYCIGAFYDSIAGLWKQSVGLKILDTNGTQLLRKIYPMALANSLMNVADFAFDGTNFYIVGTYRVDLDDCLSSFDAYAIKIDILGNLKWIKPFPAKYDNYFQGVKILPNKKIFFTGGGDNGCGELGVKNWKTEVTNIILDTNGNQLYKDTAITIGDDRLQQGSYVFPRNDSSMMVFAYRNTWIAEWEDYIFQVTNNRGHILTEAIHQTPDSTNLSSKPLNRFYGGLYYPPTKGYVMVGQTVRYKSNGIDSYTQPWILSVDSNGCVNTGCAVPLKNENVIIDKQIISIYPNPSYNGIYHINTTEKITWKILNIEGKIISQGNQNNIDISNQPTGIYYLQLQTEKTTQTTKIIKE
jgi:hypothetical protein